MLHVHSSNYLESLLAQLLAQINRGDPFVAEVIVVQNPGMSRWLSQQIAERDGISANLKFIAPGNFLWQAAGCWLDDLPNSPTPTAMQLQWRVFNVLPEFLSQSVFDELNQYLADDVDGLKRFQLAGRIAATFDQYLIYRPELIDLWQQGKEVHWQAVLWRALASNNATYNWGDIRNRLLSMSKSEAAGVEVRSKLPERVSVFGLSDMPPVYLDLLQWLGTHTRISLYYLNPCLEYWADIQTEKSQARRRAKAYRKQEIKEPADEASDPIGLLDIGNPMLASWGHAGQAFLDQLLERQVEETESFIEPSDDSLLSCLQRDILLLQDNSDGSGAVLDADDHSIQIHSAHSALREVQILHDQLLSLFSTQERLVPRDVIVMAPDIDRYAPFIDATFGTVPHNQHIPWSISDRRLRSEQQLLEAFVTLLQLPQSRFESTDIVALLQVPAIRRKFKLERSDLNRLQQWIQESGIRWSLDADMRAELGLPGVDSNSWQFGLQRMFVGYALPASGVNLYEGIAPYSDIEGTDSDQLEKLQLIIDLCRHWRKRLKAEQLPLDWLQELDQLTEAFFDPDNSERHALQSFRDGLLAALSESGDSDSPIKMTVLIELVHSILEDASSVRQFLTGRVTFSNMVPMRSIPFRVVCLLGMNAGDFPRDYRPMSFDLMSQKPRRGDRVAGNNDRYLFLETLLSAREVFYISYTGRDIRDNSEKASSTVVTEMLAYINGSYQRRGGQGENTDGVTVVQHPLQPFSKRYFNDTNHRLVGYKPHWFDAANTVPSSAAPAFLSPRSILDEPSRQVQINELVDFYIDPSKHFLFQRLEVRLPYTESQLQTAEQFDLNSLEQWQVNQQVLRHCKTLPKETVRQTLFAQGVLPEGLNGDLLFEQSLVTAMALDNRILRHESEVIQPLEVDLEVGVFALHGHLPHVQRNGLFQWRFGGNRAKYTLAIWIHHLCLCALPVKVPKRSVYVFSDETLLFRPVENPLQCLTRLLELRHQCLLRPEPFFPKSSQAFAESEALDSGAKQAFKSWYSGDYAESLEPSNSIVWRGADDPIGEEFANLALAVFQPLMDHREIIPAAKEQLELEQEQLEAEEQSGGAGG